MNSLTNFAELNWRSILGVCCVFASGYFLGWARTNLMAYACGRRDAIAQRYQIEAIELERIGRLQ